MVHWIQNTSYQAMESDVADLSSNRRRPASLPPPPAVLPGVGACRPGKPLMTTRRLTTSQAALEFLGAQVIERDGNEERFFGGVFGILGHGNVAGIGEALESGAHGLEFHQCRNEQAMVHLAIAYAKRRNRLGTFACTTSIGPGATNLVTGAAAATVNRLPVLLLPGDIFATRRVGPVLQQLERTDSLDVSVNDALRPVSRYWDRINRPEQLVAAMLEAMRVLTSPTETGAVTLSLPQDVQAEAHLFPAEFLRRRIWHVGRPRPDSAAVRRAVELLVASRRPMLICGGGVLFAEASEALAAFVESTGVPVAETQAGKSALSWTHAQNVGPIGPNGGLAANALAREADLVVCAGTRLTDFTTASRSAFHDPDVRFIGLNIVEMDGAKQAAEPLIGDARVTLEELTTELVARGWRVPEAHAVRVQVLRQRWIDEVDRLRRIAPGRVMTQASVISTVNDAALPDDVVVAAAGSLPGDLLKLWRAERPGGYHVEYGYSTMGYEVAGGLGVRLASPSGQTIVLIGDGSWLMLSTEIVTSIQERWPLTVVLIDNHGYASINGLSEDVGNRNLFNRFRVRDTTTGRYGDEVIAIDLVANAASLGALALRATSTDELAAALAIARTADRTTVIVVETDPDARLPTYDSWWDVPIAEVSRSSETVAAREDYEASRQAQRWLI